MNNFSERYKRLWTAAWAFHKKYHGIKADDDNTWSACVMEADKLIAENKDSEFFQALILSVLNELERVAKAEKSIE